MIEIMLLISIFTDFTLALYVLSNNPYRRQNQMFALFGFLASLWGVGNYLLDYFPTLFWFKLSFSLGSLVVLTGALWTYSTLLRNTTRRFYGVMIAFGALFAVLPFFPGFLVKQLDKVYVGGVFEGVPALGYYLFITYYVLLSFTIVFQISRAYRIEKILERKKIYRLLSLGIFTALGMAIVLTVILPLLGIFAFSGFDNVGIAFFIFTAAIATTKITFQNFKVVLSQLITLLIWVYFLYKIATSHTTETQLINIGTLIPLIVLGLLLIRNVNSEVANHKKIIRLTKELRLANNALTKNNQLKTEFVSIATHQLRSPLTAIKGYTSMILEGSFGPLTKQMREPIERIYQSTENLVQIVQDFLDVSRIDQGRMKYEMEPTHLGPLVQACVSELGEKIKDTTLDFKLESKGLTNDLVQADDYKLKQVIFDLIDNALKYTRRGFVHVEVYTDEPTHTVHLTVSDSGMGIKPEVMPKLFERFSRADNADEVNVAGTGLGLYIAKQIIEAHHGRIWAESEGDGKGSTFLVEMPLYPGQVSEEVKPA